MILGGFWILEDSDVILTILEGFWHDSDRILGGFWILERFWVILKILERFWKDSGRILGGFWGPALSQFQSGSGPVPGTQKVAKVCNGH